MCNNVIRLLAVVLVALSAGCTTTSQFEAAQPGTTLWVKDSKHSVLPRTEKLRSRSTGQIEFKATAPNGDTLYGILPLAVSGGKMAGSIMFFAPALFIGGFRDALAAYRFDPEAGTLEYKRKLTDEWRLYRPTNAESARAKTVHDKLTSIQ